MALTNKRAAAAVAEEQQPKVRKVAKETEQQRAELLRTGQEVYASLSEEERAKLGSLSHTLHFVRLLGMASVKSTRRVSPTQVEECSTPVGVELVSDIDIDVPVIDILKNKDTGIDPETDITYRRVKAGEHFIVSYYELMYLVLRDEYNGRFEANGDPKGAYFSAKMPAYFRGQQKLPTPTLHFQSGSVKAAMVDIDYKDPETGQWRPKPEYEEKFGPLFRKVTPRRASGKRVTVPQQTLTALALQKIIGLRK